MYLNSMRPSDGYVCMRQWTRQTLVQLPGLHSLNGRLSVRSHEVSKTRDSGLDFSNRSEIWQTRREQRCRNACQISERYDNNNIQSPGFEASHFFYNRQDLERCWFTSKVKSDKAIGHQSAVCIYVILFQVFQCRDWGYIKCMSLTVKNSMKPSDAYVSVTKMSKHWFR